MRQTAMGGKLKEMCKETARSKVGREASGKRNMIDLRQDVGFRSGAKAKRHVAKERLNKVLVRKISPMKCKKAKIMLPRKTVLVKGEIMALTRDIGAIGKVREGKVPTSHSEQQKDDVTIIGRRRARRISDGGLLRVGWLRDRTLPIVRVRRGRRGERTNRRT